MMDRRAILIFNEVARAVADVQVIRFSKFHKYSFIFHVIGCRLPLGERKLHLS